MYVCARDYVFTNLERFLLMRWFGRLLLEGAVPVGLTSGGLLRKENLKQTPAALTQMKPAPMVT